ETIHGGSTPASMRVMVIANYARFISLCARIMTLNTYATINNNQTCNNQTAKNLSRIISKP
ncbi:MAG: hypothetical protein ACNYZG_03125, partial [Gammaproteobacteria bacterium]